VVVEGGDIGATQERTIWGYAVLRTQLLPELAADLVAALTELQSDDLAGHFGVFSILRFWFLNFHPRAARPSRAVRHILNHLLTKLVSGSR